MMPGCFIFNSQHLLNLTSYNIIINFFREKDDSTDVVNTTDNDTTSIVNDPVIVIGGAFDSETYNLLETNNHSNLLETYRDSNESTAFTNNENSLSSTHINDVVIGGAFDSENKETSSSSSSAIIEPYWRSCDDFLNVNDDFQDYKNNFTEVLKYFENPEVQKLSMNSIFINLANEIKSIFNTERIINFSFTYYILKSFSTDTTSIDFKNCPMLKWFRLKFIAFKNILKSHEMSFYNTEDFTLDEIAWFNFYHKAIQKKKRINDVVITTCWTTTAT
jgi:hypothetical protein